MKFEWQQVMIDLVKKTNGCAAEGTPFMAYVHPGIHKFPDEAPALIASFFKEQAAAVK